MACLASQRNLHFCTVTGLFIFSVFRLSPQTITCSCFLSSDSAHRPLHVHVFCLQTQPTDLYLFIFSVFRLSQQTITCACFLSSDSANRPLPVHVFCLQTQPHVPCQGVTVPSVSSSLTSRPAPGMKSVQSCSCFQHSSPVPCSHHHIQWN